MEEYLGQSDSLSDIDELSRKFKAVLDWLTDLGFDTNYGRVSDYFKFYNEFNNSKNNHPYNLAIVANVFREIFELVWIYETLREYDQQDINLAIKRTLKGALLSNFDNSDNDASRNYLLELRTACYFLKNGYNIDLSTETDLKASNGKYSVLVECKRIRSHKKIKERIKDAAKQLSIRLESENHGLKQVGIIWLDLSYVQLSSIGHYSSYFKRTAQMAARLDLTKLVHSNIPNYKFNRLIPGIVSQTIYPGITGDGSLSFTGSTISLLPITQNFLREFRFRKLMNSLLKNYG